MDLQSGKPARRKNREKTKKDTENGRRAEMAEKWPPKWKNGILAPFLPFLPFRRPFFGLPFKIPFFSGFLRRAGFPFWRWPPRSQHQGFSNAFNSQIRFARFSFFPWPSQTPPKVQGPCHTKNTTVIAIHYGGVSKHYGGVVKHYGKVSETPYFPGKITGNLLGNPPPPFLLPIKKPAHPG